MAQPARKPDPSAQEDAKPQLRPRHLRDAAGEQAGPAAPNQPHALQGRVAKAFSSRAPTRLEALLMRLVIVASACLVLTTLLRDGVLGHLR